MNAKYSGILMQENIYDNQWEKETMQDATKKVEFGGGHMRM